jgi:hypothetical protein
MSLDRWCRIEDGNILVEVLDYGTVSVRLSTCDTHAKILAWTDHLIRRPKIDHSVVSRFIHLACEHHKIPLPALQ